MSNVVIVKKYEGLFKVIESPSKIWPNKGALLAEKDIESLKDFGFEVKKI